MQRLLNWIGITIGTKKKVKRHKERKRKLPNMPPLPSKNHPIFTEYALYINDVNYIAAVSWLYSSWIPEP
jgi:hypothetical protein